MAIVKDVSSYTIYGNAGGFVMQNNDGSLLKASDSAIVTRGIQKSIDNGKTWTMKQTFPTTSTASRLSFIDRQGNIYFGTELDTAQALLYRSTDAGETWSVVLTAASSSLWRIAQLRTGTMYLNEYSVGIKDANELYAYKVYKSVDEGVTWTTFYTAPQQSSPGALDGIRHIHGVWCDSNDNLYIGFGDPNFAVPATRAYRFNSNGTLGLLMSSADNGFTSMVEADNGHLIFGGDASPERIIRWDSNTNTLTEVCHITNMFGSQYASAILDMAKGKDGVIYALTNGATSSKTSYLLASGDDGETWALLNYARDRIPIGASILNINTSVADSRLYIGRSQSGGQKYVSVPDFTRGEILNRRTVAS